MDMKSNTVSFSTRLSGLHQKRKLTPESNSASNEDLQLQGNNSSQLLHQLELKNRELEKRMDNMEAKFNQELKLQVQKLEQQYEQVSSRIDGFEHRVRQIETMTAGGSRHVHNPKQYSPEKTPNGPNIDQLTKEFEERFDLVESHSQTLTETLDSCQQKFAKMNVKTENVENQIVNLQQRLNNFEMHDTNMQTNETLPNQQPVEEDAYQNPSTTDDMNTPKGTFIHFNSPTEK